MPVAVDTRSRRWAKQNPSKLLPVALYAAFSVVKHRSMPMNFLSGTSIFTSLQTFTHPQFEMGSAYITLLRREGFGSASVSPSSEESMSPSLEEELLGDNWRLPARPCPGSAGFGLGSPSALSSVSPSVSSNHCHHPRHPHLPRHPHPLRHPRLPRHPHPPAAALARLCVASSVLCNGD